ncbi:hypothetical protein ACI782_19470 [Geodermatophilus sp. SYSU D00703]
MTDGPDWVEQARHLVTGLGQTLGSSLRESTPDGGHPVDCRWCPVCQVAAVVRGERPEVTAALADVLGAAAAALRSFSEAGREATPGDAAPPPEGPAATPDGPGTETFPPPAARTSPVQRVEIA